MELYVHYPRRGSCYSVGDIINSLVYITRNGNLDLKDQSGNIVNANELLAFYKSKKITAKTNERLAWQVVILSSTLSNTDFELSTNRMAFKDATWKFAKRNFYPHWVMVQHLDTVRPHCHLLVLDDT